MRSGLALLAKDKKGKVIGVRVSSKMIKSERNMIRMI